MPENTQQHGNGDGKQQLPVEFDLGHGVVKIGDQIYPTTPCNIDTLPRFIKREYGDKPVSVKDLATRFAGSDDEEDQDWIRGKASAIRRALIGEDPCLVEVRIYGRSGKGQVVGHRLAPASDPDAQDQLLDAQLRWQRRERRAAERAAYYREKYGITQ